MSIEDRRCRVCGGTGHSPRLHQQGKGLPAIWIEDDLCSVCAPKEYRRLQAVEGSAAPRRRGPGLTAG